MDGFVSFVKQTVTAVGEEIKQQAALMTEEGLGVSYVTKRLLAMGFPYDDSALRLNGATIAAPVSAAQAANGVSARQLSSFLHKNYPDRFMIWNLSEKPYNYGLFDNQVIEFKFPGYPSPPLNQVFSLCNSLHAWLQADEGNIAVIHCQTGKGRTMCALAWYLAWSGQCATVQAAISLVCRRLSVAPDVLIPTQQRYLDYLSSMLAGKRPSTKPILLERVIMNGIPRLNDRKPSTNTDGTPAAVEQEACRPYLQIFKDGKLLYTSTGRDSTELRWYSSDDSCVLFPVNLSLDGDILVRIRHLSSKNERISMLRFGFHTGFVTPGNTRFLKPQLDGAYNDNRFDKTFWLDLIFRTPDQSHLTPEQLTMTEDEEKKQQLYWDQINSARRQTKPDIEGGIGRVQVNPDGSASPITAAAAAAAKQPSVTAPQSSPSAGTAAKPTIGSLFSSASSKLSSFSLFGGGGSAASSSSAAAGPDLSDPEVAKLHAADQTALRKAKKKAATEAAVQAALAHASLVTSPVSNTTKKTPVGADTDSFADLQAYVQGLNQQNIDSVDSDDESENHLPASASASPAASNPTSAHGSPTHNESIDLDRAMKQAFADSPTSSSAADTKKPPSLSAADEELFASLGLTPTKPNAGASTSKPGATLDLLSPESSAALEAASASLEAELAALNVSTTADSEELVLNDADEAALLASLEEEMGK